MTLARVLRWTAIACAAIAIVDPRVPWPVRQRPAVRIWTAEDATRAQLSARLGAAGFPTVADGEAASIVTPGVRLPAAPMRTPLYVLRGGADGPDVSIATAVASPARVAEQAVAVRLTVRAHGANGATSKVQLEHNGLAVASASHRWSSADETWQPVLSYLPAGGAPLRLRVRADTLPGERHDADNVADLLAPGMRGPVRALVIESGVTWPAVFVRRALEGSPAFAVAALQRATSTVATRSGSPPPALTRRDLTPYEVIVIGQAEALGGSALDTLRWFVEERGGLVVFVPDRMAAGTLPGFAGAVAFDSKTLDAPVPLRASPAGLLASELAIPRGLPPLAFALASDANGGAAVFGQRRGMGAVIVSGALDAWRYRERDGGAFARFWRGVILEQASAAPPPVEVTAVPSLARPGDLVRVTVRLRGTELPPDGDRIAIPPAGARVIDPVSRVETAVRLWPVAEPGVYEGEWHAAGGGDYVVDAAIGAANGAATITVDPDVVRADGDGAAEAIAAHAAGGAVVEDETALLQALTDRFPPEVAMRPSRPARSPWYAAVFVLLLCGEWALRRRRGLA